MRRLQAALTLCSLLILSGWTVKDLIDVGPGADGMAWAKAE